MRIASIRLVALLCFVHLAPPADAQWRSLGLSTHQVNRLHVQDGYLFACTADGMFRLALSDPDTIWTAVGFTGLSVLDVAELGPATLLAAKALTGAPGDSTSLFRSVDSGASWHPFQNGFGAGAGSSGRQARRLLKLTGFPAALLGTSGRIEKSDDGGLSWRVVAQAQVLNAIAQSPANPRILWAGGETVIFAPYVLQSTDAGDTWKQIDLAGGGDNAVDAIACHPTDSNSVYLGMEGRVMTSGDEGKSWWTMTPPDPSMYTFGMATRPSLPLKLYAAGASFTPDPRGVVFHQSLDGGLSWRAVTYPAFAGNGVFDLRAGGVSPESVYVATGNGVFMHFEIPAGVNAPERIETPSLRCRPNPFCRTTAFEFLLPHGGHVALHILDARGRTVATACDGPFEAGPHRVTWSADGLPSGIYFSRLLYRGTVRMAKVLHLR